jgi:lauroyl/myristoyl acyltransferase
MIFGIHAVRHVLCWKFLFYEAILPLLRRLGPSHGDRVLGWLGRLAHATPKRRQNLRKALERAESALGERPGGLAALRPALAANVARFLARDYPLDGLTDAESADRFEVRGRRHLESALARGRGVVLVGSHLGAHVAALHWLHRRGLAPRLLVQRPPHVSRYLKREFDRDDDPQPQAGFFVRRGLPPTEAAARLVRSLSALRAGRIVYTNGDVPWDSPGSRLGCLLGVERAYIAVWAELAVQAGAPVMPVFCTHLADGRYSLRFDPPWTVRAGEEAAAVARYLGRLEAEIAAHPADAPAHLLWPCYRQGAASTQVAPPSNSQLTRPRPHSDRDRTPVGVGGRESGDGSEADGV